MPLQWLIANAPPGITQGGDHGLGRGRDCFWVGVESSAFPSSGKLVPCPSPQAGQPVPQRVNGLCLCGKCQRIGADFFGWAGCGRPGGLLYGSDSCAGVQGSWGEVGPAGNALNPARKVLWGFLHALAFVLSEYIRLPSLSQEAGFAPLWWGGGGRGGGN